MIERAPDSSEVMLSPDLIELARSLTALPEASVRESHLEHPTTRRGIVGTALGRLFGARTALKAEYTRHSRGRALRLRDFGDESANEISADETFGHLAYLLKGRIYLEREFTVTPPSDASTEELNLYATGIAYQPLLPYNARPKLIGERLWSIGLLKPMHPELLPKVEIELEEAAKRYNIQPE